MERKKSSEEKTKKKVSKIVKKSTETPKSKQKAKFSFSTYYSALKKNIAENKKLYTRYSVVIIIVLLIGTFAFFKKNWFVVAIINGQPVTTVEYYQSLKDQNGKEVLDQMIRDRLVAQEANRKGVDITEDDINKKLSEIEQQVGGKEQLKSALESRAISDKEFRSQIKLQLTVEKLLEKEIEVSDKEVDEYITNNPTDSLVTAEGGPKKEEIKKQIQSQKLNDKYQEWYDNLEKNASITRF